MLTVKYRPFTNPKRIESNDAKRARARGVPDEFLRVMVSSEEVPSPRWEESTKPELNTDATPPSSISPGRALTIADKSPGRPESAHLEVITPTYACSPSCPYASSSSPCTPLSVYSASSSCHNSSPSYPATAPLSSSYGYQYPTGSTASTFPAMHSSTQNIFPGDSCVTDSIEWPGIDLEDPAVLAQALEIVRKMKVEEMDLDLDLLRPDHDMEHGITASSVHNNRAIFQDGNIVAPRPLPLHTYPFEFLDYKH
ncbi:hypothetical protein A7U60_g1942 [Sanghuangporus baumii]|uniref:Uncharacterized protein n=1 Tax=Sanghuangporus baumii TaxID=108892 RepID=A0A9Q5I446_SANBA|nr:hypothetical protein A7U60_g1942 [Sanghuangporus baumii]